MEAAQRSLRGGCPHSALSGSCPQHMGEVSLLPIWESTQPFIHISVGSQKFVLHFAFWLKLSQPWLLGALSGGSCAFLLRPINVARVCVSQHFLTLWATRCSGLVLCVSCLGPRVGHFSKGPCLCFLGSGVRNQDVAQGVPWGTTDPGPLSRHSKGRKYLCVSRRVCTHL